MRTSCSRASSAAFSGSSWPAVFTPSEQRGRELFFGDKAGCSRCHNGFNFNDQVVDAATVVVSTPFHNIGLYNVGGTGAYPEPNRGVMELKRMKLPRSEKGTLVNP